MIRVVNLDNIPSFRIPREFKPILVKVLNKVFADYTNFKQERRSALLKRKSEIDGQIKTAQVNRGIGEISDEVYKTTVDVLRGRLAEIESSLAQESENLSNRAKFIDRVISTCSKLGILWSNANFRDRQKIQNLVYPDGIFYDKDAESYRTDSVNVALDAFRKFTESCENGKEKADLEGFPNLPLVEYSGLRN